MEEYSITMINRATVIGLNLSNICNPKFKIRIIIARFKPKMIGRITEIEFITMSLSSHSLFIKVKRIRKLKYTKNTIVALQFSLLKIAKINTNINPTIVQY